MKIINLNRGTSIYTSNVYLILGSWNSLQDVNTLIDVGRDPAIIDVLEEIHTGVGKHKVNQVVLTHSHYDHTSNLPLVKSRYSPEIYAFSKYIHDVDNLLEDGTVLIFGDDNFVVIHTPGHTGDSVSFFCKDEGVLFSGDSPVKMSIDHKGHPLITMGEVEIKGVKIIYPGHGDPMVVRSEAGLINNKNRKE